MTKRCTLLLAGLAAIAVLGTPQANAQITDLNPNTAAVNSTSGFDMTLDGTFPTETPTVYWVFQGVTTQLQLSDTSLNAIFVVVPGTLITTPGIASVYAVFPKAGTTNSIDFTITGPQLQLGFLSPNSNFTGGPAFNLTVNGSNFYPATVVTWNGTPLPTSYVSSQQLIGTVPASDIVTAGVASVSVTSPEQAPPAQALAFNITSSFTLTSISPTTAVAGGPVFALFANGTGFTSSTQITWNGTALPTTFVTSNQLSTTVPASLIATAGVASVGVTASKGQVAPTPLNFTVTQAPLQLTSLSPSSATAGGATFPMTVLGSGFFYYSTVTWNGAPLATTYVSGGQLTATVPANLIASAGSALVRVSSGGQTQPSSALTFTIVPPFTLTSLSPSTATAGGPGFTLTLNGTGFQSGTVAYWNAQPLATTVMSANVMTATVPSSLIATVGTASITAQFASDFTNTTNALPFTITAPTLTLTSITPNTATAGSPAFTLTATGTGFNSGSVVTWNGAALATTFLPSSAQLSATVPAGLIASAGTASVAVQNGSQFSNTLSFTITAPALTLTSITPNTAVVGSPALTMAATGTGFNTGSVVTFNGTALSTSFVSATQLMAAVPANLLTQVGSAAVSVQNGSIISNGLTFTITAPPLTLTSISPNTAVAGGPGFTLSATGTGFTANTVLMWNGSALSTSFLSATQLSAAVPANLIATAGSASVVAANGSLFSNALAFTITQPGVTLTSISPSSATPGGAGFSMTVSGSGFTASTIVTWNGSSLGTTFVSANQLIAAVPANLIATPGTASVDVSVPGQVSPPALSFNIAAPTLTITTVTPGTIPAGSASFTLLVDGTGFTGGTTVFWNTSPLATTFGSGTQVTAVVPASFLIQPGPASITAHNGTQISNAVTFNVSATTLTLTSISPNAALAGGPAFTLTATGAGFGSSTQVTWNGTPLTTAFVSTTQLTAAVPATLIATAGTANVGVTSPGQSTPAPLPFTITTFGLISLSPATTIAGGPAFTLTATGGGFTGSTFLNWNGTALPTTVVSATQLSASVSASLIVQPGNVSITASNGNQVSNALKFVVNAPPPVITSISPATVLAGGATFTLNVVGTGFLSGAVVSLNGTSLTTTFGSATQVTASIPAASIAQPGMAQITLTNPTGQASNAVPLTITPPVPTITSISPASALVGSAALTMSVTGTGFFPGATVFWNGASLNTSFVSNTQVTAAVTSDLLLQPATIPITAANTGTSMSNAVNFTVKLPVPTITSISPSSVAAGGPAFTLTVTGTNFFSGAAVSLNGTALATTFVSGTQLTASVPASAIVQQGTAPVTAANTGTASSNAVNLTITVPNPAITSLSPSSAGVNSPAFTLTVNGTNFVSGAVVSFAGTALTTSFVSATQLTASVPANLLTTVGPAPVTVANPNGGTSNPASFNVTPPVPTITSISPSSVMGGGPAFTLTVVGTNFLQGATVVLNTTSLATTQVSATQLTALVPANLIAQPGPAQITVTIPNGPTSNAVTLTITPGGPTLTSISPTSANVGDPTFTLTLTGTGFVPASVAQWNGAPLSTTFVSATQMTATIDAGRLILPGTASVTVSNAVPGGSALESNALTFTINAVTPSISSLSSTSANAGSPAFSLTVNGTGFLTLTTIQWNTTALTTHFVSATQVTADVPATLLAQAGTVSVTAVNPGNAASNAVTFTINAAAPAVISSLSKTSATAGDPAFTLTLTGTGFISGAVVNFGTTALTTTFVSATQVTAAVTASLLLTPGTVQVTVQQSGTTSNAVSFVINLPAPPSLRLNPPITTGPAQQPTIDFGLNTPYPLPLTGTVTLTFVSNATVPIVDPAIQFTTGGQTFPFAVPANTTALPPLQIATGTVAGTITLTVTLCAPGVNAPPSAGCPAGTVNVTPSSGATATIVVPKAAPVILPGKITLIRTTGHLEVDITAFSTTRDMTQAVFHLTPAPNAVFTSTDITVPLSSIFSAWYQSTAATAFGSEFTYAQQFNVVGDATQIQSVTVTLTNSTGSVSATSN